MNQTMKFDDIQEFLYSLGYEGSTLLELMSKLSIAEGQAKANRKKASVTLKIDLEYEGDDRVDLFSYKPTVSVKLPARDLVANTLFKDEDGRRTSSNPRQYKMVFEPEEKSDRVIDPDKL